MAQLRRVLGLRGEGEVVFDTDRVLRARTLGVVLASVSAGIGLTACGGDSASPTGGATVASTATAVSTPARSFVRSAGPADTSRTLIIVNGGPGLDSQFTFRGLRGLASATRRVVAYDQRGVGRTPMPRIGNSLNLDYTLDAFVADIEALRIRLGVDRIDVLGHSFGALLAVAYAAKHPGRVRSLILAAGLPVSVEAQFEGDARFEDDPAAPLSAAGVRHHGVDRIPDGVAARRPSGRAHRRAGICRRDDLVHRARLPGGGRQGAGPARTAPLPALGAAGGRRGAARGRDAGHGDDAAADRAAHHPAVGRHGARRAGQLCGAPPRHRFFVGGQPVGRAGAARRRHRAAGHRHQPDDHRHADRRDRDASQPGALLPRAGTRGGGGTHRGRSRDRPPKAVAPTATPGRAGAEP